MRPSAHLARRLSNYQRKERKKERKNTLRDHIYSTHPRSCELEKYNGEETIECAIVRIG